MWLKIIIGACVIGAIIGLFSGNKGSALGNAASGAFTGGCMAAGCIVRLFLAGVIILGILFLFTLLF